MKFEEPLQGFDRRIGGSAGRNTHGGSIERPKGMPRKSDADHVVSSKNGLIEAVQRDGAVVYVEDDIDVSGAHDIRLGSDVTLVGGFCDPNIKGRGPEIICQENGHRLLTSKYGTAPTLWGVSFRGPRLDHFDPDHTADDFDEKQSTALFCYDDSGTFSVHGCEFRGWTHSGLEIGAKNHETSAEIRRSSFHHCQMEHLGYGAQLYNGTSVFDRCFFDKCRHAVSAFGYPTLDYSIKNSIAGPGPWCGHAFDAHSLNNNLHNGDKTACGRIEIRNSSIMSTRDIRGYDQEGFALRGIPEKEARIENCHFWHSEKPVETNVQGNAYRQETDTWQSFYVDANRFGPDNGTKGVGAPRARKASEDDEDKETEKPSGQPNKPTMTQLAIHGRGRKAQYRIVIDGNVSKGGTADKQE